MKGWLQAGPPAPYDNDRNQEGLLIGISRKDFTNRNNVERIEPHLGAFLSHSSPINSLRTCLIDETGMDKVINTVSKT